MFPVSCASYMDNACRADNACQPTSDNVVKVAIHGPGFTQFLPSAQGKPISTPRTIMTHDDNGLRIPQSAVKALRAALARVYPDLAAKPFIGTRLCW